jgi:hypothetical protein
MSRNNIIQRGPPPIRPRRSRSRRRRSRLPHHHIHIRSRIPPIPDPDSPPPLKATHHHRRIRIPDPQRPPPRRARVLAQMPPETVLPVPQRALAEAVVAPRG